MVAGKQRQTYLCDIWKRCRPRSFEESQRNTIGRRIKDARLPRG
jgi:hypothetical protein